ncbi:MAG: hypothetical protein JWN74_162 [Acidobacteriaceae bacterium]|nr:hypothetical protein [Acidobacteriaceae bacterium]
MFGNSITEFEFLPFQTDGNLQYLLHAITQQVPGFLVLSIFGIGAGVRKTSACPLVAWTGKRKVPRLHNDFRFAQIMLRSG